MRSPDYPWRWRGGAVLYERAFGLADRDKNEKVTPAHLFRIASVSKPITSVALFRLMEDQAADTGR